MTPRRNDIDALERAIMEEAEDNVQQILADAHAKADRLLRETEAQTGTEAKGIVQRAQKEAETTRSHAIAAAQLDAQRLKLKRREQVLEQVFTAANGRLSAVRQSPDYARILQDLIREGISHIGAEQVVVHADRDTNSLLTDELLADLRGELNINIQIGEILQKGTGVILETPDGHRRYDNTLETRLTRMQDGLRTLVYRTLMGDIQ